MRTFTLDFREAIANVPEDTKLPAGDVRKVGVAMLERFARLIEDQQAFISLDGHAHPRYHPNPPAAAGKPALPERKFARMAVRPKPKADPAQAKA